MVKTVALLRELKTDPQGREVENRVILIPAQVEKLKAEVFVESGAGAKIDFTDSAYKNAGAQICSHEEALRKDLVLGVKETRLADFSRLGNNIFMSYQHFAQSQARTAAALNSNATFIALETMEKDGRFPCLAPMSEAAAKIIARHADEYALLSKKIITSGLPETGLHGTKTAILGGGSVGKTAAEEFSERGCEVTILDHLPTRVSALRDYFRQNSVRFPKVVVREMNPANLREAIQDAFFLISSMYISGRRPEKLVTAELIQMMAAGGCIYPVDIDQGGGVAGVAETSILEPFSLPKISGTEISYFAPPNLPSMGARTASEALGTVVLPYIAEIVNKGLDKAAQENNVIATGINISGGKIIHSGLASVR